MSSGLPATAGMSPAPPPPAMQYSPVPVQPVRYQPVAPSPYGGFWLRVLAYFLDYLVVSLVSTPLFFIFLFPTIARFVQQANENREPSPEMIASLIGPILIFSLIVGAGQWLYDALLTSSSWQGSIGKRIVHLKVTDEAGNRISFARATGRYFARIVSFAIMYVGVIMVAFTDKKRGLHDMMAGTLVWKY